MLSILRGEVRYFLYFRTRNTHTHTCDSCILHYCHSVLTNNMSGASVVGCLNIRPHPVHVRQGTYSPEIKPQLTQPQTLKLHDTYKIGEKVCP